MSLTSGTQKALFLQSKFGAYQLQEQPIHAPGPGQLLVKVEVVGLNPFDWKAQTYDFGLSYPILLGSDISGVVEKVGDDISNFAIGDRVVFQGHWTPEKGGYQEYTLTDVETTAKIPSNISFESAATIPATITSGICGLYLPNPYGAGLTSPLDASGRERYAGKPIVVLGGSGNIGQNVIQLAKLSGFSPIVTTASPRNEEHLKSLSATLGFEFLVPFAVCAYSGSALGLSTSVAPAPGTKLRVGSVDKLLMRFTPSSISRTRSFRWFDVAPCRTIVAVRVFLPCVVGSKPASPSTLYELPQNRHTVTTNLDGLEEYRPLRLGLCNIRWRLFREFFF
ncbi:hypothetical protein C0991_006780 [Blastosporella zonata]|nr:hypothetical protein C0991_006780 [Blastosporella zonata]